MVALYRDRAVFDLAHQSIDHKARIGAVPDVVAKENEATYAARPCVIETRLERLAVCVNVAE
jgi:hypothetical protein